MADPLAVSSSQKTPGIYKANLDDTARDSKLEALKAKSWAELEALEFQGRVLFPGELKRRRSDGSFEVTKVLLRVPRQGDLRTARVQGRALALRAKLDLDRDKDLVESLENLVVLHEAVRNTSPPHEPFVAEPLELERRWDTESLMEVWTRLEDLQAELDPCPRDLSEKESIDLLASIVDKQSIAPLVACGPSARARFIISMANLLFGFLTSKSSSESPASSTPEL